MKKTFLHVLIIGMAIVLLSSVNANADDKNTLVSITADYWMPSLDMEVKSSELAVIGSTVDLIDDLGLDDSENVPAFRGSIDLPFLPELLISYFNIDGSATKTITKNLTYKGITYTATNSVSSSYDITQAEALLAFNLLNAEAGKLGLLVGAKYFEVETTLKDNTAIVNKSEEVNGPVPVVGVIGAIKLPHKFRLEAMARGLSIEIDDVKAALYDIEASINYDFNKFLRASAGYRYFLINGEDTKNKDEVDIKFAGPYVGVTGSF